MIFRYYPLITLFFLLAFNFSDLENRSLGGIIWSDAEGYYLYLPAVFIYNGFEDIPYRTKIQFSNFPGTKKVFTKYTCGIAMLELPFFLGAHAFASLDDDAPADGFSAYYRYGIMAAGAFYAFLGLFFLKRVLDRYFSPEFGLVTAVCLFFGTNLFYYAVGEPGMSHIYSFCLFAGFLYGTPRLLENPSWSRVFGMGLLSGLIVLIRPTNIVILLYLLLYDVYHWKDFQNRLEWIRRRLNRLWLFPLAAFLVFIPQFIYWKYISGDWLIYSYGEEGFTNWNDPKFMHVLFSIKNGWLLFSPLTAFALTGLYPGICRNKYNIRAVALITGLSLYSFASWWDWHFGGAFGYRSMVEFYALLAIPFAYLSRLIYQKKRGMWKKVLFSIALSAMIYYTYKLTKYKLESSISLFDWNDWYLVINEILGL